MDDHTFDPKAAELRRFEVITGTGRRRIWPAEVKARIVTEALAPGARCRTSPGGTGYGTHCPPYQYELRHLSRAI